MKLTTAALMLWASTVAANADVVGDAGREKCAAWLSASGVALAHMNGWAEGYIAAKFGPDYPSADVLSFMRSYCQQWRDATLFETVAMQYTSSARRWGPKGGQP